MFAGLTASTIVGAAGVGLQFLTILLLLLSKLDEVVLALRRLITNARSEVKTTQVAAKMAVLDTAADAVWSKVESTQLAIEDAKSRLNELTNQEVILYAKAENIERSNSRAKAALLDDLDGSRKASA